MVLMVGPKDQIRNDWVDSLGLRLLFLMIGLLLARLFDWVRAGWLD